MRNLIAAFLLLIGAPALADQPETGLPETALPDVKQIVTQHIIPGYQRLAAQSAHLAHVADQACTPQSAKLHAAYHAAFDTWVGVSHLRFGPSERDDRAFALAFWPDPRSSTPKALSALIHDQDKAVFSPADFAEVSIAARGFYAMEFLLFDDNFSKPADPAYHCALIKAITQNISQTTTLILDDWQSSYADLISKPGNEVYHTNEEAVRQIFTVLTTGLEFTSKARLGRPMGTFQRPRPKRAEAWRSGRSLRHIVLSLEAMKELALLMSPDDPEVSKAFDTAIARTQGMDDPTFASVANPQGRFRIEILQQNIDEIHTLLNEHIGPQLGIAAGFNSLDGD